VSAAANNDPVATADGYSVDEDTLLSVDAASGVLGNDTDVDGDPLTASVVSGPGNGTLTLNGDGSFDYTPGADFNGSDSFTYQVSDGQGGTDTAVASITIAPVNDDPVAEADGYSVDEDTLLSVDAASGVLGNDTDVDGDPLTASVVSAPGNGTLTLNGDGSFDYTPGADFNGSDSFTYQVSDGLGGTDTAVASITVAPVNDDPVAVADGYSVDEDTTLSVDAASGVLGNDTDVDGDPLTVTSVNGDSVNVGSQFGLTSGALLTVNSDGSIIYNPNGQFDGLDAGESASDSFTYTVADGQGGTDTETATITINGITDDVLPTILGTEDSDTLVGTADAELFKGLGGDLDIFTGGGGADRFDFTGLHDDGDRDAARILDWSDDDALLGISPDDVLAIRGRPGLLLLSYGQDQDKLILSGSDISGMETLEDLLGSENEQGTSIG
jgi:VCBS repeat-containing protein